MVQFMSYLRCVLCKTRLIYPCINGPNITIQPHLGFWVQCTVIKGFVYHLYHNLHLVIDHGILTMYCRSLSGNSVDLLSRTISTTMVVSH